MKKTWLAIKDMDINVVRILNSYKMAWHMHAHTL